MEQKPTTPKKNWLASLTHGLPPTYWLLWSGTLINRLGGFVIPFLSLYLTNQREIPVSQAALMVSLFGAGSFISQLVGGELTDRLGRRPVMLMSFLVTPLFMSRARFRARCRFHRGLHVLRRIFHRLISSRGRRGNCGFGPCRIADARLRI